MPSVTATMQSLDPALPPEQVLAGLDADVQRLVAAVKILYQGHWDDCAEDIRRRRAGKPYIFRLSLGLQDELEWLHRLQAYEVARGETFTIDDAAAAELLPVSKREDPR
jgi:hypothetical protein